MTQTEVELADLISSIGEPHQVLGRTDRKVRNARPIDRADGDSLCFCKLKGSQALEMISNSESEVIVCSDSLDFQGGETWGKTIIQTANPRLTYSRLLARFFYRKPEPAVHSTAVIDPGAKLGESVSIGPGSYVGDCEIGDGSIIDGNVYIYDGAKIGRAVVIHAGAVIGADAIAFERNERGELEWFPQLAGVEIEDNVEIGANSVVCRGSLSNTIVGRGTKIDIHVIVAHGDVVGKDCVIAGGAVICGSAKIGDRTWIGPHSCVREGVTIGDRVTVGAGSVVHKDVADGLVVTGSPARPTIATPSSVKQASAASPETAMAKDQ